MTLKEITELYNKTFYMEDPAVLPLIASIVVGSKLKTPAVWAYIIGPSSGGKSELINAFSKVKFCTQVSDLTTNTFLSGMSNQNHETSLLKRLGMNFVILMKDFTTILSKSQETQEAVIAQMREIYDGHMTKEVGTGKRLEWGPNGKATFIMASTEAIYAAQDKFADMGTRAINYVLKPQDRILTTKRALKNNNKLVKAQAEIQDAMAQFIADKVAGLPEELPEISEELEDQIIEVANFSSICRSVVKRDYRGEKSLALSAEMPMRMAKQLLAISQQMRYINDGEFPDEFKQAVFKTGFDSIPKQRRIVLEVLAKYQRVDVSGVADRINYNPQRAREWIEDLNMFGVCNRIKGKNKEYWELKDEYRQVMIKYFGIVPVDENLEGDGDQGYYAGAGNYKDESYEIQQTKMDSEAMF